MLDLLSRLLSIPWPWYIAGPLIGLMVPLLLLIDGRLFGVSSSLRHLCAATIPAGCKYLRYDWRRTGLWNLLFVAGIALGGFLASHLFANPEPMDLAEATRSDLAALGVEVEGFVPESLFGLDALTTIPGLAVLALGGFLIGFGARWGGGCTSGHAISGLAALQLPSLLAVLGFFAGGLASAHFLLPLLLGGAP